MSVCSVVFAKRHIVFFFFFLLRCLSFCTSFFFFFRRGSATWCSTRTGPSCSVAEPARSIWFIEELPQCHRWDSCVVVFNRKNHVPNTSTSPSTCSAHCRLRTVTNYGRPLLDALNVRGRTLDKSGLTWPVYQLIRDLSTLHIVVRASSHSATPIHHRFPILAILPCTNVDVCAPTPALPTGAFLHGFFSPICARQCTMRLSNGTVNVRASASPSKSGRGTTMLATPGSAEDLLCENGSAWPPLLPTFAEANNAAVGSFVSLFVSRRIEYKCGQCPAEQFLTGFLEPWLRLARTRVLEMDALVASSSTHLTDTQAKIYQGCVERLLSAIRDAQLEVPPTTRPHEKSISFARPVAHRIVRHSCDRFSLRSVTDDDRSEYSLTPPPSTHSTAAGTPEQCVRWSEEGSDADEQDGLYTARTSGVYYGDVVHGTASSRAMDSAALLSDARDAGAYETDSDVAYDTRSSGGLFAEDPLGCMMSSQWRWDTHRRTHQKRLRVCWLVAFYAVPATVLLGLLVMYCCA